MRDLNSILSEIQTGGVIVNIGQDWLNNKSAVRKTLDRMVKRGELAKWRGKWFPVTGASFGIGPDKTCWALPVVKDQVSFPIRDRAAS